MLQYQEFRPHPALRPYVNHYAALEDPVHYEALQVQQNPPILNKGLMFHYRREQPLWYKQTGKTEEDPFYAYFMAQSTRTNTWQYRGGFGIFAAVFKPGMFRFLFPMPMAPYNNYGLSLADYNDPELLHLYEQIVLTQTHAARVHLLDKYLLVRARHRPPTFDLVQYAMQRLYRQPSLRIEDVAKEVHKSPKHFRTLFHRAIGVNPKAMQQFMRFTHLVHSLRQQPQLSIGQIAYNLTFTDQAHLNRVFKQYTGMTPLAFRKSQGLLLDYITHHDAE